LLVGLDAPDDAAVYRLSDETALVQTVDFFTPIVDDARAWGRIAAANALSDVYAMGGRPITALNLVGWPRSLDFEILGQVLEGGEEICSAAGTAIVGGHSVDDPEPKYGLAVTGLVHPDRIVRKTGAAPGDVLILTKPIGTGIISSGIKEGRATTTSADEAIHWMTMLNRSAAEAMTAVGVSAATDVTGFGLIGHLLQMLGSDLGARLESRAIPLIDGAMELSQAGVVPGGSKRNFEAGKDRVEIHGLDDATTALLFDAQTSGGLLIAVHPGKAEELLSSLRADKAERAAPIGQVLEGGGTIEVES
jgi:selenide,water dikinase